MKGLLLLTPLILACAAPSEPGGTTCPSCPEGPAIPLATGALAQLGWLAGEWVTLDEESGRCTVELWMTPAGTSMIGGARTLSAGRTAGYEHLRIEARQGGEVVYVANPSGQAETEFRLTLSGQGEAVFENPAHDFPARIRYARQGDDLLVRIEGQAPEQVAEWTYRPVRGPGAPCP